MAAPASAAWYADPDPGLTANQLLRDDLRLEPPQSRAGAGEWAQGTAAEPYACRDARLSNLEHGVPPDAGAHFGPSHPPTPPGGPVACAVPDWQRQYRPATGGLAPGPGGVAPGPPAVTRARATTLLAVGVALLLLLLAYAVGRRRATSARTHPATDPGPGVQPGAEPGAESGAGGAAPNPLYAEDWGDAWRPDSPPPLPRSRAPPTDPLFQPLQDPPQR